MVNGRCWLGFGLSPPPSTAPCIKWPVCDAWQPIMAKPATAGQDAATSNPLLLPANPLQRQMRRPSCCALAAKPLGGAATRLHRVQGYRGIVISSWTILPEQAAASFLFLDPNCATLLARDCFSHCL